MKEPYYHIALDDNEHSIIIKSLNDERNTLLEEGRTTDAVDDLIVKVGNAPYRRIKVIERDRDDARYQE